MYFYGKNSFILPQIPASLPRMRKKTCIDQSWKFLLGDIPSAIHQDFNDSEWRALDLPHDWSIEGTPFPESPTQAGGGYFPAGIGWYRKELPIPADLGEQRILLEFDGIYMNSEVWCNGKFCGNRPYGYSSFCYDITPFVKAGETALIAVRVDNSRQRNSRWYSGSGIYRHVWLTIADPVRVAHWGTFVTTPNINEDVADVCCEITLDNDTHSHAQTRVKAYVDECSVVADCEIPPENQKQVSLSLSIPNPRLWSPESPELYMLNIEVIQQDKIVDKYQTRFGVRSIRFDANNGFFLNGNPTKFKGVNEHHDAGCLGAAVPDDELHRRLKILKAMGCNAIRIAHNPASPTLLDLCDEYGFMVVEDAFDEWRDGKTPFGYQLYFDLWWQRDLTDMLRRDRNHPCIVIWSVGNEIVEVRQGKPAGLPIMKEMQELCHREDPTRPMTCGCCNSRETLAAGYARYMDIFGYNGGGGGCFDYEKDHANFPNLPMFASEHPHTLQTRGVYRTKTWYRDFKRRKGNIKWYQSPRGEKPSHPLISDETKDHPLLDLMHIPDLTTDELFTGIDEHYQSSYGNAIVRMSIFDSWYRTKTLPFFCGEFRWTGFDYIGECYGWPAKSWNFGIIDLCGFPKDAFYFLQSQWADTPMVHVLPHWTWPGLEGKEIPVMVYSNGKSIELFLNDQSLGKKTIDEKVMYARWNVPYQPGTLKAVAYQDDAVVASAEHKTASEPTSLRVTIEEDAIHADRTAIAHAVIEVVDANNIVVPHANPDITVEVEGPATLIGLENGDPIDSTNYKLNHRKAFNGMMLAIVQSNGSKGTITIHAKSDAIKSASGSISNV